eukprot:scaffold10615_cov106-Isochrysis_galbana.AAC.4
MASLGDGIGGRLDVRLRFSPVPPPTPAPSPESSEALARRAAARHAASCLAEAASTAARWLAHAMTSLDSCSTDAARHLATTQHDASHVDASLRPSSSPTPVSKPRQARASKDRGAHMYSVPSRPAVGRGTGRGMEVLPAKMVEQDWAMNSPASVWAPGARTAPLPAL